jgi:hypothetical protein
MTREATSRQSNHEHSCIKCGKPVNPARWELGYNICMSSACVRPAPVRTIVPMHKSNYMVITDRRDLMGINNKGGFYR